MSVKALTQTIQRAIGVPADGVWGPVTAQAVASRLALTEVAESGTMAWGARVSKVFRDRVQWIANELDLNPDDLMTCMAWESGRTFSPSILNKAGSGATGLIQFMPKTAIGLGTTTARLAQMTAEDQLNYVFKYFRPFKGRLKTLSDMYMAILWPGAVGAAESHVLWDKGGWPTTYRQNAGLDANRDGAITKGECTAKLAAMKAEGLRPENVA